VEEEGSACASPSTDRAPHHLPPLKSIPVRDEGGGEEKLPEGESPPRLTSAPAAPGGAAATSAEEAAATAPTTATAANDVGTASTSAPIDKAAAVADADTSAGAGADCPSTCSRPPGSLRLSLSFVHSPPLGTRHLLPRIDVCRNVSWIYVSTSVAPITVDYDGSRRITTDLHRSRQITTDHHRSQRITTDHDGSRRITVGHDGSRR